MLRLSCLCAWRSKRNPRSASGFILVTVLLLLAILSFSAFIAMERSQFSLKIMQSRQASSQALHRSEQVRYRALPMLEALLSAQDTVSQHEKGQQPGKPALLVPATQTAQQGSLRQQHGDLLLAIDLPELKGEVYVRALPAQINTHGVAIAQHMAYQGAGKGLGSSESFSKLYELRARGVSLSRGEEVSYWTASDYRFIP